MKIIHQNGYTHDELSLYRLTIYKNLIDCMKALIAAIEQFEIEVTNPETRKQMQYIVDYNIEPDPHTVLDRQVGEAITEIWKDPSASRAMDRQSEFYLMDSAP